MEGVRILAETAIYDTVYSYGFHPVLIFFGAACLFCCWLFATSLYHAEPILIILSAFAIALCIFGCFEVASKANAEPVFSHTEYKVIIEDGVEFNEFLSHYEILDQEGEIYTVKEKGDANELSQ